MSSIGSNAESRILAGLKVLEDRVKRVEEQGADTKIILLKLGHLSDEVAEVRRGVDKINSRVGKVETNHAQHETRIALMERFCHDQVKPALELITENRVQIATILAKWGAGGLGIGGGIGMIIFAVGKAAGWW